MRDCHCIGIKSSVDTLRLMKFMRVIDGHICYNVKESFNLYEVSGAFIFFRGYMAPDMHLCRCSCSTRGTRCSNACTRIGWQRPSST